MNSFLEKNKKLILAVSGLVAGVSALLYLMPEDDEEKQNNNQQPQQPQQQQQQNGQPQQQQLTPEQLQQIQQYREEQLKKQQAIKEQMSKYSPLFSKAMVEMKKLEQFPSVRQNVIDSIPVKKNSDGVLDLGTIHQVSAFAMGVIRKDLTEIYNWYQEQQILKINDIEEYHKIIKTYDLEVNTLIICAITLILSFLQIPPQLYKDAKALYEQTGQMDPYFMVGIMKTAITKGRGKEPMTQQELENQIRLFVELKQKLKADFKENNLQEKYNLKDIDVQQLINTICDDKVYMQTGFDELSIIEAFSIWKKKLNGEITPEYEIIHSQYYED